MKDTITLYENYDELTTHGFYYAFFPVKPCQQVTFRLPAGWVYDESLNSFTFEGKRYSLWEIEYIGDDGSFYFEQYEESPEPCKKYRLEEIGREGKST